MTTSSIRSRTDRASRPPTGHRSYVDGANALRIGYADPAEVDAPPVESAPGRTRRTAPDHAAPTPPGRSAPRRRMPGSADMATPAIPAAPPLPVALPRPSFLILLVSIVAVGVLGVLVLNTKINENSFQLDTLQARQAALDLQEQQLGQALAERESTGNLRAAALRLGLVPAGAPAFITLPNGQVVGVPQPASGSAPSVGTGR